MIHDKVKSCITHMLHVYGIFTYICVTFRVNVGKYSIHGAFGLYIHIGNYHHKLRIVMAIDSQYHGRITTIHIVIYQCWLCVPIYCLNPPNIWRCPKIPKPWVSILKWSNFG